MLSSTQLLVIKCLLFWHITTLIKKKNNQVKLNLNNQVSQGKINPDTAHTNQNSYLLSRENLGLWLNACFLSNTV